MTLYFRLMKKLGVTAPSTPAPSAPAKPRVSVSKSKGKGGARAATIIQSSVVDDDEPDDWTKFCSWLAANSLSSLEPYLGAAGITSLEAARTFKGKDKLLREELGVVPGQHESERLANFGGS